MAGFLKVLLRNVLQGPSTDPFPLGETFTPKRFRGKVVLDPDKCMGCGICRHTCAAGAINIHARADQSGYDFTVWHNSCCLCASCRHYCPTKAITLSDDWHNAHEQGEKFQWLEQHFVPYVKCEGCGTPMRPLPVEIAKKIYINNKDIDIESIVKYCPNCRRMADAQRNAPPPVEGAEGAALAEGSAPEAPKPEAKPVPAEAPKAEVQAEVKAVPAEAPKAEVKAEAKVEAPKPEPKPEAKPVAAEAPKVEAKTPPKVEVKPQPAPHKGKPAPKPAGKGGKKK